MRCVFCLTSDGGFTSREHALPESMGNLELILPPGVVCDRCNNEVLSRLDQSLCDFSPVKLRRTMLGVTSKAGKLPTFRSGDGTVQHVPGADGQDPTLIFSGSRGQAMLQETAQHPDGRVSLNWSGVMGGPRLTTRYAATLSRALLKAALECAWLDHGDLVYEGHFDHVRDAVLGRPRSGFVSVLSKVDPGTTEAALTYVLDPEGNDAGRMLVLLNYAGIMLATDSRLTAPKGEPTDPPWLTWAFAAR
jgi:hypothetical protein